MFLAGEGDYVTRFVLDSICCFGLGETISLLLTVGSNWITSLTYPCRGHHDLA